MQHGQRVTVVDFEGKELPRVVVADKGEVVLICKEEEFEHAKSERREPVSVGFKRQYVTECSQT